MNSLKFLQLNATHTYLAHLNVLQYALEKEIDFLTIQDAYINFNYNALNYRLLFFHSFNKKSSIIVTSNKCSITLVNGTLNTVTFEISDSTNYIYYSSVYSSSPPHDDILYLINEISFNDQLFINHNFSDDFKGRSPI